MRPTSRRPPANSSIFDLPAGVTPDLAHFVNELPELNGKRLRVRFQPQLTAHRGKLLSKSSLGTAVLAGSFLRKRTITLDDDLLTKRRQLRRIFAHELFHFVWLRLSNSVRREYELVVEAELRRGARGELGWSAELAKDRVTASDWAARTRRWREYVCESFCDTAGWIFGKPGDYAERTLAASYRGKRRVWFRRLRPPLSI